MDAAAKTVKHALTPSAARSRGRGQLEHCAIVGVTTPNCRAVERAGGVEDYASIRKMSVAAAVEAVQRAFGPSAARSRGRDQLEYCAAAGVGGAIAGAALICRAVDRAGGVKDQFA